MKKTFLLFLVLAFFVPNAFGSNINAGHEEKKITINGTLKQMVEKGGWLIVSGKKKFLIVNAGKYRSKSWFVVGAKVRASGSLRNHPTFFMEGTPFKVDELAPRKPQKPRCRMTNPTLFESGLPESAIAYSRKTRPRTSEIASCVFVSKT
ncbi:MAG: hypothetical protein HKN33_08850 [Pyrinomonadaceae bacterium]|nr:hypothetical protein [Pyrinomonadaceae bacterium]